MKISSKLLATAMALGVSAAAQATTLTFDGLNRQYGDGPSIDATTMTNDDQTLT